MKTIGPVVLTIYTENLAEIDLFLPKLHRRDVGDITFSHWRVGTAKEGETTGFILVEANKSIQELEGKITELKRKVYVML